MEEQTLTGNIATRTGVSKTNRKIWPLRRKKKKKKRHRKTPLALTYSGVTGRAFGFEQKVRDAVDEWFERYVHPGPGRKRRSGREMKRFKLKKGLLGISRQRMK